jgi:hypothetical protein
LRLKSKQIILVPYSFTLERYNIDIIKLKECGLNRGDNNNNGSAHYHLTIEARWQVEHDLKMQNWHTRPINIDKGMSRDAKGGGPL